ncbi:MAG: hypothetical protein U5O39_02105 [Gammaproteobacteria bacterium]|nr:hypothetical protein [Gammaproteobacteria bacterium]
MTSTTNPSRAVVVPKTLTGEIAKQDHVGSRRCAELASDDALM